jgi:hypothetical protein
VCGDFHTPHTAIIFGLKSLDKSSGGGCYRRPAKTLLGEWLRLIY